MTLRVISSLPPKGLAELVAGQLNTFYPDGDPVTSDTLNIYVTCALARLEHCFVHVDNKYFFDGTQAVFNHLHGDQYAMWLYLLSNEIFRQDGPTSVASKLFLLNKALHGCDIFYEVALPDIFLLVHPLATVLGRGSYADFFVAYQRVGVGSNHDVYPTFGCHVTLRPGSAVLGRSSLGKNCQIGAESFVLDRDLPPDTLYIGSPKTAVTKPNLKPYPLWRT